MSNEVSANQSEHFREMLQWFFFKGQRDGDFYEKYRGRAEPAENRATFPSETPAAAAYEAVNEDLSVCKSALFGCVRTRSVAVSPGESQ